jgi:hypothetical protein
MRNMNFQNRNQFSIFCVENNLSLIDWKQRRIKEVNCLPFLKLKLMILLEIIPNGL